MLPLQILIVDDDPAVRALLKAVVRREGAQPLLAASGVEGHAALAGARSEVALILLDLSMPEMDGFRFRELQLDDPELAAIPIVVLTGFVLSPEELSFMRPAAVLTKPASVATIRATIRRVLTVPAPG
jgi:CheY-like chemotaxis protein